MADEPAVDTEQGDRSTILWKPALKVVLALIAVWVVTLIFVVVVKTLLSFYLQPLWISWWEYDTGRYPIYMAIEDLLYGVLMLVLAGLLVTKKSWHDTFFDELQPKIRRRAINYFTTGLIVGALGIIFLDLITTLADAYLFKQLLYVNIQPERLAVAVLLIVPLLVLSIGQVALIQGYFQRTISRNYGEIAGIFVAAIIYLILHFFPILSGFIFLPLFFADDFFVGVLIAYLFMRSKSLYMPIGFTFAWYLFSYVFDGFITHGWIRESPTFLGFTFEMFPFILRMAITFLFLMLAWYVGSKSPEGLDELKGKLNNAVDFFRFHDDEE